MNQLNNRSRASKNKYKVNDGCGSSESKHSDLASKPVFYTRGGGGALGEKRYPLSGQRKYDAESAKAINCPS